MTPELSALFARVDDIRPEMMSVWSYLVNQDSGTKNKAKVDELEAAVQRYLERSGFAVRYHEYENAGNLLVAERGDTSQPFVCLVGHLDTVFADGTAADRPFTVRDGRVTGPGSLDMKGGVTVMLSALQILNEAGWKRYPVKVLLAGDEEVAHRGSNAAHDLVEEARGALFGLNFETSFNDNRVVLGRKGYGVYKVEVSGIGAHAGNNPEDGRSAILELARKIPEMEALADHAAGTLINVGVMGGGTVPNAIPEKAWCTVDVRYTKTSEIERVKAGFTEMCSRAYVDGTKMKAELTVDIPAMERTAASEVLFEKVNAIAQDAGLPAMTPVSVGGGSDSVFLSRAGVPTLCALGVKGEGNHTEREYALESSLAERVKLLIAVLSGV